MKNITDLQNAFAGKKKPKNQNQWLLDAVAKQKNEDTDAINNLLKNVEAKESKRKKDLNVMKPQFDNIYALTVKDIKNSVFYVGRTSGDLQKRLKQHLYESKKGTTKKCIGIRQILAGGCEVDIELLEKVSLSAPASSSEEKWIWELENLGITLLNSKAGDGENYIPLIDNDKPAVVWTVKDILNAVWVKEGADAKKGEFYSRVNGVDLYRKGWSMLRFKIAGKNFKFHGMVWEISCKNVVDSFTAGTKLNKTFLDRIKK